MNSCFELKSISDDNISVEVYFADKTLEETLDILHKFLVASGYSVESGSALRFAKLPSLTSTVAAPVPQEFTARA